MNLKRILTIVCLSALSLAAAGGPDISASVSRRAVATDESVRYTIRVSDAKNVSVPVLGEMEGFRVMMGPSQSSNISIINGVKTSSQEFIYELQPLKAGKLTIGEAQIIVDGSKYYTRKITVDVSEAKKSSKDAPATTQAGGEVFLELSPSVTNAFLGEQIFLTITLYYRDVNLANAEQPVLQLDGFDVQNVGTYQQDRQRYRGQIYNYIRFQKLLIPWKVGKHTLQGSMMISVNVPLSSRSRSRDPFDDPFSLFQRYRTAEKNIIAEPLAITVSELPSQGGPKNFKGAIGVFALQAAITPVKVKEGEPVTLKATLVGIGNIDQAVLDMGTTNTPGFTTYDPVVEKKTSVADGVLKGYKNYSQMWVPLSTDVKEIPALTFCYFDVDKKSYQTLTAGPFPLEVEKSAQSQAVTVSEAVIPVRSSSAPIKILSQDIFGIKLQNGGEDLSAPVDLRFALALLALPLLLFLFCSFIAYRRTKTEDPGFKRKAQAAGKAENLLRKARRLKGDPKARMEFLTLLNSALTEYVADTANVPAASVDSAFIRENVGNEKLAGEFSEFTRELEMARFSGLSEGTGDNDSLLAKAHRILKDLRREMK